jgi:predicted nuclease with TOPRIM domain
LPNEITKRQREAEKAFWMKTLQVSQECLDLDRRFIGALERKTALGADPLEPSLWENFIEARRDLVDCATENLNLIARDKKAQSRQRDIKDRLETTLGEVMRLEEKLTSFLAENLSVLKDAIEDISKNQVIFSAYGRHNHKPRPEALETTI